MGFDQTFGGRLSDGVGDLLRQNWKGSFLAFKLSFAGTKLGESLWSLADPWTSSRPRLFL